MKSGIVVLGRLTASSPTSAPPSVHTAGTKRVGSKDGGRRDGPVFQVRVTAALSSRAYAVPMHAVATPRSAAEAVSCAGSSVPAWGATVRGKHGTALGWYVYCVSPAGQAALCLWYAQHAGYWCV